MYGAKRDHAPAARGGGIKGSYESKVMDDCVNPSLSSANAELSSEANSMS